MKKNKTKIKENNSEDDNELSMFYIIAILVALDKENLTAESLSKKIFHDFFKDDWDDEKIRTGCQKLAYALNWCIYSGFIKLCKNEEIGSKTSPDSTISTQPYQRTANEENST